MIYFIDVDVVTKLATCGFLPWLPELLGVSEGEIQIHYLSSLRSRLNRQNEKLAKKTHKKHLETFCSKYSMVTGTGNVTREEELLHSGMDVGEAILFAEAETTGGIVVTGDKRALRDYKRVSTATQRSKIKVICWEQLLLRVHQLHGYEALKQGCCEGLSYDGLLRLVFSNGRITPEPDVIEGLLSYLKQVREHSGDLLVHFD